MSTPSNAHDDHGAQHYETPQPMPYSHRPAYPASTGPAPTRTEPMAIVALCLAVAGPATCGLSSIVGAILGTKALHKIRTEPGLTGEGLAKGGIIIGWIIGGLVLAYVLFLIVIAFLLGTGTIS